MYQPTKYLDKKDIDRFADFLNKNVIKIVNQLKKLFADH